MSKIRKSLADDLRPRLAVEESLVLITPGQVVTHDRGGILDLFWTTSRLPQTRPASEDVAHSTWRSPPNPRAV